MLFGKTLHEWMESIGMTAAWLQAWGSLAALIIALCLASYNQRQESKREIAKQVQYMEAIAGITLEAVKAASNLVADMNSSKLRYHGLTTSHLDSCMQALRTISLESLPNAKAYMAIHQLRQELDEIYSHAKNQQARESLAVINPSVLEEVNDGLLRLDQANIDFAHALIALK